MNKKIEKLKNIISEIDDLISKGVTSTDSDFLIWKNKAKSFILTIYEEDDFQYKEFDKIKFHRDDWSKWFNGTASIDQVEVCRKDLLTAKGLLENILETLEEENEFNKSSNDEVNIKKYDKVFIVHGHDGELKQSVARIIEKQGIDAIILSEQANKGRTIIEKFEDNSDVSGAICLFTADDLGKAKKDSVDNSRARQNVVLETGYFMGKLGRDHVVILADKGIEMPSDLSGVVYTDTGSWETDLLKELKAMGYTIDYNKLF